MAKVTNLKIDLQNGTTNTVYATWEFKTTTTTTSSSTLKAGSVVKIKAGSTYYNGVDVPDWVEAKQWIVQEVKGDRVVINKDTTGQYSICSAISAKNLTVVSGSSSTATVTTDNLDYYDVKWYYATGDGVWFSGSESNVKIKNATYSFPSNAIKVKVSVKPVSKTYQSNGKTKSYWSGTYVSVEYIVSSGQPEKPSAPSVNIEKYKLTATIENIEDSKADQIEFYVVKGDTKFTSGVSTVVTQRATFSCSVTSGEKYRVRCRAINVVNDSTKVYSEWSTYSSEIATIPASVTNVKCAVDSETSVKVSWTGTSDATSYEVEYTTNKLYFDSSSEVHSLTVESTNAYVTGLDSGDEWFFRIRAKNDQGESGWSGIVSTVIGSEPSAPTTWSLTTTAIVGDTVTLYWVHNSEDGSKQTAADIELTINGSTNIITVTTTTDEDEEEKTYSYILDLSSYTEGAEILWRVRTKGIVNKYSDWSIQRTINLYAPPTLVLGLDSDDTGTLQSFPYNIVATAGPITQNPVSYHVSVIANDAYESEDIIGEPILVSAGEEVYSKIFNVSDNPITITISAGDIILKNNQSYTVFVTVSMSSGLTAEANGTFTVSWGDDLYEPDAAIAIDRDAYCTYISPFCIDETNYLIDNVVLSVYRREADGSFTELATDLPNDGCITITDPHPSLDYARYRIVARNESTSVIGYEDIPGEPIGESSIIIQWNETWKQFDYDETAEPEIPAWTGSLVRLPYNIDITEKHDPDVSLVEYIGRKHPVSYYGTQRGENATWTTEIPKSDKETIYALRRLSAWDGDVYVREPSGTGYRAQITISMSIKHTEVVVPVTIDIKRVEGDDL